MNKLINITYKLKIKWLSYLVDDILRSQVSAMPHHKRSHVAHGTYNSVR